ncbi:hypothetical protein BLL37_03295 [Pseudomonas azotoformans]|uniref:Uncharacterized protein n=2 Tax=Pseudomonas azotoformans TaxID=47878 RepID=A0A1V2JSQ5_PSEAZ|nr:hypothetical protein BFL39_10270 [Pseudomonas azotoformans]ONH48399.1 hypothetical protein BLL37_03295 [Pseudomonas azotoformans]
MNTTEEGIVFLLRTYFDKFEDPKHPGSVTREHLAKMAYFPEMDGVDPYDSAFARAILEKDRLFEKLDGYGKDKHDGKIDQASLASFERKDNGRFSTMSDRDITRHLFDNFNDFKLVSWSSTGRKFNELSIQRLQQVLNSKNYNDEKKMFIREFFNRPELMQQLGFHGKSSLVTRDDVKQKLPYIR